MSHKKWIISYLGLEVPKALPRLGSNSFIETFFSSRIGLIKNVRLQKKFHHIEILGKNCILCHLQTAGQ